MKEGGDPRRGRVALDAGPPQRQPGRGGGDEQAATTARLQDLPAVEPQPLEDAPDCAGDRRAGVEAGRGGLLGGRGLLGRQQLAEALAELPPAGRLLVGVEPLGHRPPSRPPGQGGTVAGTQRAVSVQVRQHLQGTQPSSGQSQGATGAAAIAVPGDLASAAGEANAESQPQPTPARTRRGGHRPRRRSGDLDLGLGGDRRQLHRLLGRGRLLGQAVASGRGGQGGRSRGRHELRSGWLAGRCRRRRLGRLLVGGYPQREWLLAGWVGAPGGHRHGHVLPCSSRPRWPAGPLPSSAGVPGTGKAGRRPSRRDGSTGPSAAREERTGLVGPGVALRWEDAGKANHHEQGRS
jgi:hypothetical protein